MLFFSFRATDALLEGLCAVQEPEDGQRAPGGGERKISGSWPHDVRAVRDLRKISAHQ
jgi:hypothetical protein